MNLKMISLSALFALGTAGSVFAQSTTPQTESAKPPTSINNQTTTPVQTPSKTSAPATEQKSSSTTPASHPMWHMRTHKHDAFSRLNLTPDQRTKIDGIIQQSKQQAEQNRQNTDQQIEAVLTPEQKTKWEAQKQQHREHMQERRKHKAEKSTSSTPSSNGE